MAHPYPTRFAEQARKASAAEPCVLCGDDRDVSVHGMYQTECHRCQQGQAIAPLLAKWFRGFDRSMYLMSAADQARLLQRVERDQPTPEQLHRWLAENGVAILHAHTAMRIWEWAKCVKGEPYGYDHILIHQIIDPWCLHEKRTPFYMFCYYGAMTYHPNGNGSAPERLPQTKEAVVAHWRQFLRSTPSMTC